MTDPEKVKTEQAACRAARAALNMALIEVNRGLRDLYDGAPAYAGEVEAVKEAIDTAVRVLSGKPPD